MTERATDAETRQSNDGRNLVRLTISACIIRLHVLQRRAAITVTSVLGLNVVAIALRAQLRLIRKRYRLVRLLAFVHRHILQLDFRQFVGL